MEAFISAAYKVLATVPGSFSPHTVLRMDDNATFQIGGYVSQNEGMHKGRIMEFRTGSENDLLLVLDDSGESYRVDDYHPAIKLPSRFQIDDLVCSRFTNFRITQAKVLKVEFGKRGQEWYDLEVFFFRIEEVAGDSSKWLPISATRIFHIDGKLLEEFSK